MLSENWLSDTVRRLNECVGDLATTWILRAEIASHKSVSEEELEFVVVQSGLGRKASGVRSIENASGFHIREHSAKPAQVEAALLYHVLD
jgi:hypothetical protein